MTFCFAGHTNLNTSCESFMFDQINKLSSFIHPFIIFSRFFHFGSRGVTGVQI